MWNSSALFIPDVVFADQAYTLSEDVFAMELVRVENGDPRLGPVSKIPRGAEIQACGDGFNERTIKIRWQGKFYFVFLQDLEAQRKPAAAAARAS